MNDMITKKEAMELLGMYQNTFDRYAARFGIKSEKVGRCALYDRQKVEEMRNAFENEAAILISRLEKITRKKVKLV